LSCGYQFQLTDTDLWEIDFMRTRTTLLVAPILLVISACSGGDAKDSDTAKQSDAKAKQSVSVKIADSNAGRILVDQSGRTLYAFIKDKDSTSSCKDDCIAVWPALTSASDVKAGKGAQASLLGETQRGKGVFQATYGDWPLYYYVGDAAPGDINGQNLDDEWFVVGADGKLIKKPA
jgi:predicted lipoprotein with Yx(FWY)xxD motif